MGFEPMTCRLRIGCSTTKLRWHGKKPPILDRFSGVVKPDSRPAVPGGRRTRPAAGSVPPLASRNSPLTRRLTQAPYNSPPLHQEHPEH